MKLLLAIAVGGAVGALGRHFVTTAFGHWFGLAFPWGTLAVNVSGSFALGVIAGLGQGLWQPGLEVRALLVTGVLGAFTTFSAFSLDVVTLFERGATGWALLYVLVSVIASVGALFAALALFRLA